MNNEDIKKTLNDAKITVQQKYDAAAKWLSQNKEIVGIIAPLAVSSLVEIVKTTIKHNDLKKEEQLKYNSIYDRSKGHWYHMKREPKPKEWAEIDRRKDNGENYSEILTDMKLLKK